MLFISNLVFFSFWWVYFHQFDSISGWTIQDMAILFSIVSGAYGVSCLVFGGSRYIAFMIDSGQIEVFALRPRHALVQALFAKSLPSGFGDILSSLVFFVASSQLSLVNSMLLSLFVITGAVLISSYAVILGSLAFWFRDSESLGKQLFEFILTFSNYPDPLFQGAIRMILFTVIPSGMLGFLPATIVKEGAYLSIGWIIFFVLIYASLACSIFNKGMKRYSSASTFSTNI